MPRFPVEANDFLHGFQFRIFPFFLGDVGWFGEDEHAGFDFEFVGVPTGQISAKKEQNNPRRLVKWVVGVLLLEVCGSVWKNGKRAGRILGRRGEREEEGGD